MAVKPSAEWPLYTPKDAVDRLTPQTSAFQTRNQFEASKETNGVEFSLCDDYTREQYKALWMAELQGDDKHTPEEQRAVWIGFLFTLLLKDENKI